MHPDRWSRVEDLLARALDIATGERSAFLAVACDDAGGGQTLFPSTFANVTTDATGRAAFNQAAQFLPAGRYLTALARGFSTTAVIPALMISEFSNCVSIGTGDAIFADGFD